jgi:hypothetical protein
MAGTDGLDWRLDIGRTHSLDIVGMPLLEHYAITLGQDLLSGIYGSVQRAVHHGFKYLGPTFLPRVSHPNDFPAAMSAAVHRAITQLTQQLPGGGSWMIIEDGGYAFPALHDDPELRQHLGACLGAVEHTTRGKLNDQYLEVDAAPIVPRQL